jgi:MFS family permease
LLVDRDFGPFFWGNAGATLGMWAYSIAAVVVVFQLTHSPSQVGLVTIAQFAAPLLLAPVGGALADRLDRRRVLLAAQAVAAVALGVLAVLAARAGVDGMASAVPVFAVSLVLGTCTAVADPARQALLPALVPGEGLGSAIALNGVTFNLGRAVGPAVAGMLLPSAGPATVFAVSAAGYLLQVLTLLTIRVREARVPGGGDKDRGMAAGVRYLLADRRQLFLLMGIGIAGFGSDPVLTLAPLLADQFAGVRPEVAAGLLASSFGAGAVLTVLLIRPLHVRLGYRVAGLGGMAVLAGMLLAAAGRPGLVLSCALLLGAGMGYFLAVTSLTTLLQLAVPEHLRGRVMALWGVAFLGSRPLAAFLDSTLAALFSPQVALAAVASLVALTAAWVWRATSTLDVPTTRR